MGVKIKLNDYCPGKRDYSTFINYLATHSKYNFKQIGDELEFYQKKSTEIYFELLQISEGSNIIENSIEALKKWLREYKFTYPSIINDKDLNRFGSLVAEKKEYKDKLALFTQYLFRSGNDQIDKVINMINPEFVKMFRNGRIYFLKVHEEVNLNMSAMRILFASREIPEVLTNDRNKFEGIKTLHSLDCQVELGGSTTLNPFFGLFPPYLTGISSERVGGAFILLFDKPTEYTEPFPGRIQDIIRKDSTFFSETFKTLKEHVKQIEKIQWDIKDLDCFLHDYVGGMNRLYQYLLEPTNYEDIKNRPYLDVLAWHFDNLTIRRIAHETLLIETEFFNHFIKRTMLFSMIDQLSSIIHKHSKSSITSDGEAFKEYFKERCLKNISFLCGKYPSPFNNFFRNRCNDTIKELYKTIQEGIFVSGRLVGRSVILKGTKSKQVDFEEYVTGFIRGIRNTHHGYNIEKPEYLTIHDGNITNKISSLAIFTWLALLRNPSAVLEGKYLTEDLSKKI